jgi:imidazolonepropionase-like amidohydrolase
MTGPNTAEVWAEHSIWPHDPGFIRALEAGVTSLAILPGSANLFGGRIVTVKNLPSLGYQGMKFPGAPHGLKMACGENPKRVYGERRQTPMTRMGNIAATRNAWIAAADYQRRMDRHGERRANGENADPPTRDLRLETLSGVLRGEILVHNHCYRADEMLIMLDLADEFGYSITSFHHAVEAYKIADVLARRDVCSSVWADWWGFKIEAWDGIRENAAIIEAAGACTIIHSDSSIGIQRLNQEAAKAMAAGRRAGIEITPESAIRWITLNPARSLGIADRTGSIERDKMADIVVWDRNPFSVYARPEVVFIDGARAYDRNDPARQPRTDFELGNFIGGAE